MSEIKNRLCRRILVPHDFSSHATRALEIAAGLAGPGSAITVLHALPPVYSSMGGPAADLAWAPTPAVVADVRRQLTRTVERALGREDAARVRCRVELADPLTAILAAAKGADLIVMTTLGRTGLGHLLMGSVAEKVVRHATVPVLTVHPKAAARLARSRTRVAARPRAKRKAPA
ncbi:MAG: universal stress protein [Deltaproteobacteria bacterium]|nr:universal stress protein [Deltaproteobacteria bacterium]